MTGILVRAVWLTAIYLLVLASLDPVDIATGIVLALLVAAALPPAETHGTVPRGARLRAILVGIVATTVDVARGSWHTVLFCLRRGGHAGLVEIPRDGRSPERTALWGLVTGEAPDEFPVEVDEERDVLIVHLLDARDPEAVRERHRRTYERWQREAAP